MFAVIKTGGKQYRVEPNDVIRIERLDGEAGDEIAFDHVLMLGDGDDVKVGAPQLAGATVIGTVLEQARGPKIIVFKKKRRKNYRRTHGHRQDLTVVRITDISADGKPKKKAAAKKAPAKKEAAADDKGEAAAETKSEAKTAAKPAAKKPAAKKPAAKAKAEGESKTAAAKKPAAKKPAAKKPAADKDES